MKTKWIGLVAWMSCSMVCAAQEKGNWRASSKTAYSTTGDLGFKDERISISLSRFALAQIREVDEKEIAAVFANDTTTFGPGNLYRVSIPGDKTFVTKNTICGGQETQWLVIYVVGKTLRMAAFSGGKMPELTGEAMASATNFCGTFTYTK
jgi:hypothetical protein